MARYNLARSLKASFALDVSVASTADKMKRRGEAKMPKEVGLRP